MMNDACGRPALRDGHGQSIEHDLGNHARAHCPADDPSAPDVEDNGEIEKARQRWDVGHIGHPELIRSFRDELSVDQIRRRPSGRISTRGVKRSSPTHTGHTRGAHQSRNAFPSDTLSAFPQFRVDPRRTVRSPGLRVNANDLFAQRTILSRSFGLFA
jgi:hypothetical protein